VRSTTLAATLAFAAFGAFWGAWGASIPRVRAQAGLDHAELGVALLFVGAGALPAMLLTGRAIDRWGLRVASVAIAALGLAGVATALGATDLASTSLALTLVGITSGASDVAINSVAGRAERDAGRPFITRAHGVFSSFVVVASLGTGLLTNAGAPVAAPFVLVAIAALLAATLMARALSARPDAARTDPTEPDAGNTGSKAARAALPTLSLIGLGLLGALAFASENAHQSWSAVFATDALGASPAVGTLAPAVFAGVAAITRFSTGRISAAHARPTIAAGATAAATGAVVVALSPDLAVGALGIALAAAGTAVMFPMILSVVSSRVDETSRGRATSIASTVAYLGFLLGPSYVGFWSDAVGLRGAMVAVACLGALLLVLAPLTTPGSRSATLARCEPTS
jgi:MFS family permease